MIIFWYYHFFYYVLKISAGSLYFRRRKTLKLVVLSKQHILYSCLLNRWTFFGGRTCHHLVVHTVYIYCALGRHLKHLRQVHVVTTRVRTALTTHAYIYREQTDVGAANLNAYILQFFMYMYTLYTKEVCTSSIWKNSLFPPGFNRTRRGGGTVPV